MGTTSLLSGWAFQLPNFVLAALMYTLLGRFLLSFFFGPASTNYIWRAFVRMTDPVLRVVGAITPRAVPDVVILAFGVLWLLVARIALFAAFAAAGAMPAPGGAS